MGDVAGIDDVAVDVADDLGVAGVVGVVDAVDGGVDASDDEVDVADVGVASA